METRVAEPTSIAMRFYAGLAGLIDSQRGVLLNWVPVCLGIGIGTYFGVSFEPGWAEYTGAGALFIVGLLVIWRLSAISAIGWAMVCIAAGFSLAGARAHLVAEPTLSFRYYGPVQGRVIAIDKSASDKTRLTLDHVVLDRMAPDRTPKIVRISLHGDQPFLHPEPGMTVIITGHLSSPSGPVEPGGFDFQRNAWFKSLGAVGYTRIPALMLEEPRVDSFSLAIYKLRIGLSQAIKSRMSDETGPFASAILTGDRTDIDQSALEDLRASNLAHLLAISGLHMGLLTGVIFALVRIGLIFVPMRADRKKIAAIAAFVVALAYLGISGASVATQRAFVMVSVMLFAICLERRALTLRAVAVAAVIVLIMAPHGLVGPGFQMSFAATIALVAAFGFMRDHQMTARVPKRMRPTLSLILSSAIAGLATAPFGAAHFNQTSHYGLVANLLSVPVMGIVIMPGAVLASVLSFLGLEFIGLWFMEIGIRWILFVADTVAGWPGSLSLVPAPAPSVLPIMALGGLILCLWQGWGRLSGLAVMLLAAGIWSQSARPDIIISETGRLVGVLTPEGRALNKAKGDGFAALGWLENDGDGVDQEIAAARGFAEPNWLEIPDVMVFHAAKDVPDDVVAEYCALYPIVVMPRRKTQNAPCQIMTEAFFRREGAVRIDLSDDAPPRWKSNRSFRGDRLWTPD
jgi:competence protein ComEC